jgi:organic hydroperoxide reductase OsmC/OhrA
MAQFLGKKQADERFYILFHRNLAGDLSSFIGFLEAHAKAKLSFKTRESLFLTLLGGNMAQEKHSYLTTLVWEGRDTANYDAYSRRYRLSIAGKPHLEGSADPSFRGETDRHNPEDLLVGSIAACHMLTYLALCAKRGINVLGYEDAATGRMASDPDGGAHFEEVVLHPIVTIEGEEKLAKALELHERANKLCFIARSCNFPIRHEPELRSAARA